MLDLLIKNARVVTCQGPEDGPGDASLGIIDAGAVGVSEGRIAYVGPASGAPSAARETWDAGGRVVLPGLVDPHTHLVFGGSRVDEFARRMAGEDYRKIAAEGGGIARTVRGTREADDATLLRHAQIRAQAMTAHGVTSCEVKSGYGLTTEHEVRMLRAARALHDSGAMRVTTTFLGAHAVPPERRDDREGYVREVVEDMLPEVVRQGLADACDVYCDDGAFTLEETRRVLTAAKGHGLAVRAHVGQFTDLGGAELVAELGGLSADHLEAVSDAGLLAMAKAGVVAVLLPGAFRTLRQAAPDARRMREAGVRVAVGTDCNPGTSPATDLTLMASLAVRDAGLTLEEAILGVTAHAARAAGLADVGVVAEGAHADLALYDHDDPRALAYCLGDVQAFRVLRAGRLVHEGPVSETGVW